eukprot:gene40936-42678_t
MPPNVSTNMTPHLVLSCRKITPQQRRPLLKGKYAYLLTAGGKKPAPKRDGNIITNALGGNLTLALKPITEAVPTAVDASLSLPVDGWENAARVEMITCGVQSLPKIPNIRLLGALGWRGKVSKHRVKESIEMFVSKLGEGGARKVGLIPHDTGSNVAAGVEMYCVAMRAKGFAIFGLAEMMHKFHNLAKDYGSH